MTNYGERTGTGGPGTAIITNDDEYLLDIPEIVDPSEEDYGKVKDSRSY